MHNLNSIIIHETITVSRYSDHTRPSSKEVERRIEPISEIWFIAAAIYASRTYNSANFHFIWCTFVIETIVGRMSARAEQSKD